MKKTGILFIILLSWAAIGWSQSASSQLETARTAYDAEEFESAIDAYEEVLSGGQEAFEVYYNLGNSYFKSDDIPRAILNFERAKKLNPEDEDLLYNLDLANKYTVDKFKAIPQLNVTRFYHSVISVLSSDGWAWGTVLFFLLTLLGGAFFYLALKPGQKKLAIGLSTLFLVLTLTTFIFSWQAKSLKQNQKEAIVFQPTVTVLSEPRDASEELFVVHEGTKVSIVEEVDEWTRIRLSDGNDGWMLSENVIEI